MAELLATFSIGEIVLFVVLFAVAVKGVVEFIDWFKRRVRQPVEKDIADKQRIEEIYTLMKDNQSNFDKVFIKLDCLSKDIDLLKDSDRNTFKDWIKEVHERCMAKGKISYQLMEIVEKKFAIYKKEGGNSFAPKLVSDLENLQKFSADELIQQEEDKKDN